MKIELPFFSEAIKTNVTAGIFLALATQRSYISFSLKLLQNQILQKPQQTLSRKDTVAFTKQYQKTQAEQFHDSQKALDVCSRYCCPGEGDQRLSPSPAAPHRCSLTIHDHTASWLPAALLLCASMTPA